MNGAIGRIVAHHKVTCCALEDMLVRVRNHKKSAVSLSTVKDLLKLIADHSVVPGAALRYIPTVER